MPRFLTRVCLFAIVMVSTAAAAATTAASADRFEEHFLDATLRIDFTHTGAADEEIVALDRLYREDAWPGPRRELVDPLNLGRYRARVLDGVSGALLWSRGFDSYFGEWKTTAAAADGVRRTYHESVRMPFPRTGIVFALDQRGADNSLNEIYRVAIDPKDPEIRNEPLDADIVVIEAHVGGAPAHCVDVVILGEGYTTGDLEKFTGDLRRFAAALLSQEPFASMTDRLSLRGVLKPSQERGCDEPTRGVHRNTALGCTFNSLGSERYLLTEDNRAIRDVARAAPYDVLSIMVNHQRYGGGGIYNLFNTFTSDNQWSDYVFVHEFGHGFAGLADEYYSSSTAYTDFHPEGFEPVERNITRLPGGLAKWRSAITPGAIVPTPWNKAAFDTMDAAYQKERERINARIATLMTDKAPMGIIEEAVTEGEDLSRAHQGRLDAWFAANPATGQVGAFEGAGYCPTGVFRAEIDCIMFTKGLKRFCAACAIGLREVLEASTD